MVSNHTVTKTSLLFYFFSQIIQFTYFEFRVFVRLVVKSADTRVNCSHHFRSHKNDNPRAYQLSGQRPHRGGETLRVQSPMEEFHNLTLGPFQIKEQAPSYR